MDQSPLRVTVPPAWGPFGGRQLWRMRKARSLGNFSPLMVAKSARPRHSNPTSYMPPSPGPRGRVAAVPVRSVWKRAMRGLRADGVAAALASTDADTVFKRQDKDFAIADL